MLILFWVFFPSSGFSRNVILFVGDGMGQAVITAARWEKALSKQTLALDSIEFTAFSKTHSADDIVTDSAAGATALACGAKTNNGSLGVDTGGKKLQTLAEIVKATGRSVGMVTNTRITHATPAAFYAHIAARDDEDTIASQLLRSDLDLALGGGRRHFQQNQLDSGKWTLCKTYQALISEGASSKKPVLGLFAKSHLAYMTDRKGETDEPTLTQMTEFAVNLLKKNRKGFFLMVEGGRIDHAEHDNNVKEAIYEMIELDNAIQKAQQIISSDKKLKESTLVLVTSDHETGGLAINGYLQPGSSMIDRIVEARQDHLLKAFKPKDVSYPILSFATGPKAAGTPKGMEIAAHTGVDVPVYAWGIGAENVHGTLDNTDIFHIMKKFLLENKRHDKRSGHHS